MSWQGNTLTELIWNFHPLPSPSPPNPPHIPDAYKFADGHAISLVATGHVDKGAIISAAGDSSWAASADFQVNDERMPFIAHAAIISTYRMLYRRLTSTLFFGREILQLKPEEMKAISAIVSGDDTAKDKAFADGLFIAGSRYVVARADGRSIYARSGRLGVAIAKTKQAIVVGHHGEAQVAGNTSSTVEGLADYLIGQGY
ncbi:hypothetical protein E4U39_005684 [Claviceps sp. Clav50 group G5]|nr:hypothetical protein E4U39_005684 [Claviceps sp. Clav50 group G5]